MATFGVYCPYETLQSDALGTATPDPDDIEELRDYCTLASRMFDGACKRHFYPLIAARDYDHPADDTRLLLDEDLLEVSTFTTQNGDTTITSGNYYLMCGGSYNVTPYDRIVLKSDSTQPNLSYSGTLQKANTITATWGYHEDWANAWQDSGDTLQAAISSTTATSCTVSDVDGAGVYGMTPRFRVQDLIKIDDEFCYVTAKNTSTNVLTLRRGANGSTAATHDNGSTVYVYRVMHDIETACRRLAKWLYDARASSYTDELTTTDAAGVTRIPPNAPALVRLVAERYKRRRINR